MPEVNWSGRAPGSNFTVGIVAWVIVRNIQFFQQQIWLSKLDGRGDRATESLISELEAERAKLCDLLDLTAAEVGALVELYDTLDLEDAYRAIRLAGGRA